MLALALSVLLPRGGLVAPPPEYAMSINRRAGGGSRTILRVLTPTTAKPHLMVFLQGTTSPRCCLKPGPDDSLMILNSYC